MRLKPGYVLTAEARQWQADRQAKRIALESSPMGLWDRANGGHLRRELDVEVIPQEAGMKAIDALRAAMAENGRKLEGLAKAVARWTPAPRKEGEQFAAGSRAEKALDGSSLAEYETAYVEAQRRDALAAHRNAQSAADAAITKLVADAVQEPITRLQAGTAITAEARAEIPLLLEEFRGRTRQEMAELLQRGHTALDRGDLQTALAVARTKAILRLDDGEFDDALVKADPVRQEAKAELDEAQKLADTWYGEGARRRVVSGVATDGDRVRMVDAAAAIGQPQDGSAGSFIESVAGQQG